MPTAIPMPGVLWTFGFIQRDTRRAWKWALLVMCQHEKLAEVEAAGEEVSGGSASQPAVVLFGVDRLFT